MTIFYFRYYCTNIQIMGLCNSSNSSRYCLLRHICSFVQSILRFLKYDSNDDAKISNDEISNTCNWNDNQVVDGASNHYVSSSTTYDPAYVSIFLTLAPLNKQTLVFINVRENATIVNCRPFRTA